jgi:hypothetical protein
MLCYCLSNTPIDIVQDEIRREHYRLKLMEDDIDIIDQVQKQHNFDHIPDNKRVKVYTIKRDNEVIEQIKAKVELCRDYFNQLIETI